MPTQLDGLTVEEIAQCADMIVSQVQRALDRMIADNSVIVIDNGTGRTVDLGEAVAVSRAIPMAVPVHAMQKIEFPADARKHRENRPKQTRAQWRRAMKGKP